MKKAKRIASLVLAVMIVLPVLAGCKTGGTTAKTTTPDNSKFATVNIYNFADQTNENWKTVQNAMNKYIKDNTKLNCAVALHYMTWTNWQSNYATLIASGQQLDLVNSASDWLNMWENAQKGAFVDLKPLLPEYAPKTWAKIPQTDWAKCTYNSQIVCIPEDHYTQWVNHGFMYRGDWSTAAGLGTDISTWDGIGQYMAWVKANKPGVTPWDVGQNYYANVSGWITSTTQTVSAGIGTDPNTWALKSKSDFTITTPYTDEANMTTFATKMKQWADAGYWKTDVLTNTDAQNTTLEAGTNGMYQHHVQTFASEKVTMDTKQPGSNLQMFGWWQPSGNLESMTITHGATCIGSGSKNPGRALEVMDLIENNKDFYMLYCYGIKDSTYFLNDKGQLYTPDGFDVSKSGYQANFWGGREDEFEPDLATRFAGYNDYSASLAKIAYPDPIDGWSYDATPVTNQVAAVNQVITSEMPGLALGKSGDPATAVKKLIKDLKAAGLDAVTADMQKSLSAWKAKK
jgi:putative aldouronate transport system substrate-binding protein